MTALLLIGSFFLLLFLGMPVFIAMSVPSLAYILWEGVPIATLSYTLIQSIQSFPIVAVPMFVLVGKLVNELGGTRRIFAFARHLFRNTTGCTAYVNIVLSLVFSGMSGAALADIGGLGQLEIKAMKDEGFKETFGAALTAATATVGPIFPPSIPLIIYAMAAEVSSVRALLAGVVPGVMLTALLTVVVFFLVPSRLRPDAVKYVTEPPPGALWKSFVEAVPTMLAVPVILGCMLTGVFSPTEAGAAGVVYMLLVGVLHGELRTERVTRALRETLVSVSVILLIVSTGAFFTRILTMEKLPTLVSTNLLELTENPVALLLIVNAMVLVIGMFMESISSIVLLTPMLLPVAAQIEIDPIHLGLILVLNLMIGMTTPPFGIALYVVCEVGKTSPEAVLRELLPMYVALLGSLVVVTFVPGLSLWIPSLLLD